jgi:hypothetical protein
LDDALHAGSSALEILGAIAAVLSNDARMLGNMTDRAQIDEAIAYVRKAYGQQP